MRSRRPPGDRTDPTGAGPDAGYTDEELAFLRAIDAYKAETGRRFPSWCEALQVLKGLGYRKVDEAGREG